MQNFEIFQKRRPLLNIILDGYAIGRGDFTDGVFLSPKPCLDSLFKNYASSLLVTHGKYVGLPDSKDMGGSEVGHLTIGAGKVFKQGTTLIKDMLEDGSFFEQPVIKKLYQQANIGALHLIGLLSDGNVHSHIDHFEAVISKASTNGVKECYLHVLLDGRDTAIQSALIYVERIEKLLNQINTQNEGYDYRIVSGGGRETITMDRVKNWDKVELGWRTHVLGQSGNYFKTTTEAIKSFRAKQKDIIDQDLPPFNIWNDEGKTTKILDKDSVLCMNFRGDRAVEISRSFSEEGFNEFELQFRPKVYYAGLMVYDEDTKMPENVIVRGAKVPNPFGKRILELGLNQFRLAETQKYPHVTFFFNGGYRLPLDSKKEEYVVIESDNVASFASKPKMQALPIAHKAVQLLDTKKFDYGLINFANPDMVGHTGDIEAVKIAINEVDQALSIILKKVTELDGLAIITADHGNADEMLILNKKTNSYEVSTKHTLNPVPFLIFDPSFKAGSYRLKQTRLDNSPLTLSNIAATNFVLLSKPVPPDLDEPIIEF